MCDKFITKLPRKYSLVFYNMYNFSGGPEPLVITSGPEGWSTGNYTVAWREPETNGNPIKQYKFKIKKVNIGINNNVYF